MAWPDTQTVAEVVREAAQTQALPRFKQLQQHEVSEKSPGDLLTVADLETERVLTERLAALLPGSVVVGEEAVSANPGLLDALHGDDPCWIVDPIDGTINFAGGLPLFATMVALVSQGQVVGGWVYDAVHDVMAAAERHAGTVVDGVRIRLSPPTELRRLSGCLHLSGYDRDMAARAARNFEKMGPLLVLHCAGLEYQMMLLQRLHYSLYRRTNPWDHAPGHLLLTEAGGHAQRLNGDPYRVTEIDHPWPLVNAANEECWQQLRRDLFEVT